MQAVICPVCNSRGKVPADDSSTAAEKECHGCGGRGWVEVGSADYYPPVRIFPYPQWPWYPWTGDDWGTNTYTVLPSTNS